MGEIKGTEDSPMDAPTPKRIPNADKMCLTPAQAQHVYDCVTQEITYNPAQVSETVLNSITLTSIFEESCENENFFMTTDYNPYMDEIIDYGEWTFIEDIVEDIPTQEISPLLILPHPGPHPEWSVFSSCLKYPVHPTPHKNHIAGKGCMDFDSTKLKSKTLEFADSDVFLHMTEGFSSEYINSAHEASFELNFLDSYNDSVDISVTYLGEDNVSPKDRFYPMCKVPFTPTGRTVGTILGGPACHVLIDTGATTSYLSKTFYLSNPCLHSYPKFTPRFAGIQVGNGAMIPSMFIIPLLIKIAGHKFEIYTIVADLSCSTDLVVGIKNLYKLEASFNCRTSAIEFVNRSLPIFPLYTSRIRPGCTSYVKARIPFVQPLSGVAVIKIMHGYSYGTLKAKIVDNFTILQLTNNTDSTIFCSPDHSLGIVDVRSLGYYNINLTSVQDTLNPYFQHAQTVSKTTTLHDHGNTTQVNKTLPDPYPWLDHEDPRKTMTDEEILHKYIDLSDSDLSEDEKNTLMGIIIANKQAFSLRDEIGHCTDIQIDIEVIDDSPFFVRPFPISEADKKVMNNYMKSMVDQKVLTQNSTTHTSPVMMIPKKGTSVKRPVVDFRFLNTRLLRRNTSTPLMRDIFNILGRSKCQVLSCVDLKDAYHSIPLTPKAKEFCGILPYFGSPHYRYEVLPMGLSISPQVWIDYIERVLQNIPSRESYLAIMDDLLLFGLKSSHMKILENLLHTIISHGLKISPRKCQLFKTQLVYMGNEFSIEGNLLTIRPLQTRIDAIMNCPSPTSVTQCKRLCGMVNYMSLFCKNLQEVLKPIYHLTKKGVPYNWGETQDNAFTKLKQLLTTPPVLHVPIPGGRFILYCDTSRTHTGSSLWQMQYGKPRLIGYASKSMPPAAANYSVTELEMTGLTINIHLWRFLVYRNEFDCAVDHSAIPYIMKAKTPPASPRIMRLLEILSNYGFNLYYVKGKDMKIADFLSRIDIDTGNPHEVIPIAFNAVTEMDKNLDFMQNMYMTMTRARSKQNNLVLPDVSGPNTGYDPNLRPEHQHKSTKTLVPPKIKSNYNDSWRKNMVQKSIKTLQRAAQRNQPVQVHRPAEIPVQAQNNVPTQTRRNVQNMNNQKLPDIRQPKLQPRVLRPNKPIPLPYPNSRRKIASNSNTNPTTLQEDKGPLLQEDEGPLLQEDEGPILQEDEGILQADKGYLPRNRNNPMPGPMPNTAPNQMLAPPAQSWPTNINKSTPDTGQLVEKQDPYETGLEIPFSEETMIPSFRVPNAMDFAVPPLLGEQIQDTKLYHKYLPKQSDIDKILTQINRKYLTQMHLPCSIRDMQAAYLSSPHFKDIYNRIYFNRLPSDKKAIRHLTRMDESDFYMIQGNLLYKYQHNTMGIFEPVLCVPQSKIHLFLAQFHSSLIGGHMGMSKVFRTLTQKLYCPNLPHFVRMYIIACHTCQLFKTHKKFDRTFQQRIIDITVPSLVHMSMDIKHMPPSGVYKFILVLLCEVSNFLVASPLKSATSPEICSVIMDQFIAYFGCPVRIISDQDPAFMSTLTTWFFQQYGIKLLVVSPTNHKSLLAEHGIKSLSNLLIKHMTDISPKWDTYLRPAMLTYNSYCTPNLDNMSPFQIAMGRNPVLVPQLEITPSIPISGTFKEAHELHQKKLDYMRKQLVNFRNKRQSIMNKDKGFHSFSIGQIVYLYNPRGSVLHTNNKKFNCEFVGPLVIYKCISPNQFLLCSLDGIPYHMLVEETRLKPGWVQTTRGPVNNLADLVKISRTNLALPGVL